jgi:hypothetical protein
MNPPILVRLPSSHRRNRKVQCALGYAPHEFYRMASTGRFAYLPETDAKKLLNAGLATLTRVGDNELLGCWYQRDPFRGTPPKDETCVHAPARLYAFIHDGVTCPRCCECGTILKP